MEISPCEFYSRVKLYTTRHPKRASHDGEEVGIRETPSLGEGPRPLAHLNFTLAMRGSPTGLPRAPRSIRHQASPTLGGRMSASLCEGEGFVLASVLLASRRCTRKEKRQPRYARDPRHARVLPCCDARAMPIPEGKRLASLREVPSLCEGVALPRRSCC